MWTRITMAATMMILILIMRTLPVTTTTFGVLAQVLLATVMQEVLGAVVHTIFSSGKHSCKAERS